MLEHQDQHYLILEYGGGGDLRGLLTDTPQLPLEQALNIALDLADALTRAHRLGIIHRDLKSGNVLLAADGTPRLSDFGIAKINDQSTVTQTGMVWGTVAYLSPEGCMGEPLDERTDIWSFGVLLYEMLAGRRPFTGEAAAAALFNILSQPTPDISEFRADLPEALQDLLYRMLTKEPLARIPSIRIVGTELEAILAGRTGAPAAGDQAERFAATPLPAASAAIYHNLPPQPTAFVGREVELAALTGMLAQPEVRLLTILGPGGMGKTRLALAAAEAQLALELGSALFADGILFVDLAPLTTAAAVVTAIAGAVGLPLTKTGEPEAQLLNALARQRRLFILDNFEQLLADPGSGALAGAILDAAPGVKLLVTSRERLKRPDEHLFQLGGLDFPEWETPADALHFAAVQLFRQSARRVRPDFELTADNLDYVARICRLAHGMPLGIVLAAAWLELLSPQEVAAEMAGGIDILASEMTGLPERQRSIRAVFDYSWDRLSPAEQDVLAGLSVFRGGFDRPAAQAVTGATLPILLALANKSLLSRDAASGRFQIHELLRQYAAERLAADPERAAKTRDQHSAYFCADLQRRGRPLKGAVGLYAAMGMNAVLDIAADFENVRLAWQTALVAGRLDRIDQALECLTIHLVQRHLLVSGESLLGQAAAKIAAQPTNRSPAEQQLAIRIEVKLLLAQSVFRLGMSRHDALPLIERCRRLLARPELKGQDIRSEQALLLGVAAADKFGSDRDPAQAAEWAEQSAALSLEIGAAGRAIEALATLGWAHYLQGDSHKSQETYQEMHRLRLAHQMKFPEPGFGEIIFLSNAGDLEAVAQIYRRWLEKARSLSKGLYSSRLLSLCGNFGWNLISQGNFQECIQISEEGLAANQRWPSIFEEDLSSHLAEARLHLGEYEAVRQYLVELKVDLGTLGLAHWALGEYDAARTCWEEDLDWLRQSNGRPDSMAQTQSCLVLAQIADGRLDLARDTLAAVLTLGIDMPNFHVLVRAMSRVPLYFAAAGAAERAVTLYALAATQGFVANSQWTADMVGQEIERIAAELPPAVAEAARARGRQMDLWTAAQELAAQLEGEG